MTKNKKKKTNPYAIKKQINGRSLKSRMSCKDNRIVVGILTVPYHVTVDLILGKIAIWMSIKWQKFANFSNKLPKIVIFSKKYAVGNFLGKYDHFWQLKKRASFWQFLTFKWQCSGGSAVVVSCWSSQHYSI